MSDNPTRVERAQKPAQCPECGKAPVARILYGYAAMNDKLAKEIQEGRITLGGCCISMDDPALACTQCGLRIFPR